MSCNIGWLAWDGNCITGDMAVGGIVSQYKNCIVTEAGQCCIAIQSLGHDTAMGRALGARVCGASGRRRLAGAQAGC